MSDHRLPPGQEHRDSGMPPPPPPRTGCLSVFLVFLGMVLMLPGLCAIILIVQDWKSALSGSLLLTVLVCIVVSVGGFLLFRAGLRTDR